MTGLLALVLVAAGLGPVWYFSDAQVAARAHGEAIERWEAMEPTAYRFEFSYCSGMCAPCPRTITVTKGEVTGVEVRGRDCPHDKDGAPTIEDVLALADRMRSDGGTGGIEYNHYWGYPESADFLCSPAAADCGEGFTVTSFHALPRTRTAR